MAIHDRGGEVPRRSFFSRLGVSLAAAGAAFSAAPAGAQPAPAAPFTPAKHAADDWFDQLPGRHRLYLDTTTVDGIGHAIFWANNFLNASRTGYQLTDQDSAIVIGMRHESTPFAFNDAMWAKYGAAFEEHAHFVDPTTKKAATINLLQAEQNRAMANRGVVLDAVVKRGVHLAVCSLATRAISGIAARQQGRPADDIVKELTANLALNAHMVPAGIVAMSRAQERGFTFGYVA
jgi:intracellular sulfur oxidation DsrE/DsrF family protein